MLDWKPSATDPNAGSGRYGACCSEMDIWEANSVSSAYTPHPCTVTGPYRCEGTQCGDGDSRYSGVCDKDGCDFNAYRMGDTSFYGKGQKVDTSSKFTVVTQFLTADNTTNTELVEIRRLYVQNGKVIRNTRANVSGIGQYDSITDKYCVEQKSVFGDTNDFKAKGGNAKMGAGFKNGMVLAMSIWDDHAANMLWLDSSFPLDKDASLPGVKRGSCPTTSGKPSDVESQYPNASVTFSNIKFGDIGSTYKA
jgi:cellulose 1,4-beta-cellobiosidase